MKNIDNLKKKLNKELGYIIEDPLNVRYLTGCNIDTGILIIIDNTSYFITDFRYIEVANSYFANTDVNVVLQKKLAEDILSILQKHNVKTLVIEAEYQTLSKLSYYQKICSDILYDGALDEALLSLRMIKQPYEIENIRKAQDLTDNAFSEILEFIRPGVTERDIGLYLEMCMRTLGGEAVAFDLIAISGENTSLPHGIPSKRVVEKGDFITMDFGCKVNGYCSDMTRTIAVGYATDQMIKVYNTVLDAQLSALDAVRNGVNCSDVDKAARDIINSNGYEGCFGHATGHGVGLYIHEEPRLSVPSTSVLKSGMVVTIEPGIYIPKKFGVRIEDMVVVTDNGCENFTQSNKQLVIL